MRWIKVAVAASLMLGLAVVWPSDVQATPQSDFIAKLIKPAQANERATGIPASVAIGMAALETGWGRSSMTGNVTVDKGLPTEKVYSVNTLFNIKCTSYVSPYQTGCVPIKTAEYRPDGSVYYIVDEFRTYKDWGDSLLDYGRLLTTNSRYAKAFDYKAYPDQFVTEVRKGGYATDPKYADLVISIMKSNNLYQYNVSGAGPGFPPGMGTGGDVGGSGFVVGSDLPGYLRGSKGEGVSTLQRLLNVAGASLEADGIFGAMTVDAVTAFQGSNGLTASGQMDDRTWQKLLPVLVPGAKGGAVSALQAELKGAGLAVTVNGSFDAATQKAVREFQTTNRIEVTGEVNRVTWARLIG